MSISAPLSSTASSSHPFFLTIALQGPAAVQGKDASESTPLDPTPVAHAATNGSAVDVFDAIDSATSPWTIENPPELPQREDRVDSSGKGSDSNQATTSNAPTEAARDAVFDGALSDTHSLLYGTAGALPGRVQESATREAIEEEEDGLPDWMKETSGRVTSTAVGYLRSDHGQDGGESRPPTRRRQRQRRRPSFRLAVGSEDGNVWIFAHPHAAAEETEVSPARGTDPLRQENGAASLPATAAPSLAVATSTDAHGESSRAGSSAALNTLLPTKASNAQHRPLRSHRSSGSITTLGSLTSPSSVRSRRIVSASSSSSSAAAAAATMTASGLREPSHSSASLQSFDFARVHPRPRKASATVSISTSPAEPSTACHSRARTPAPTGAGFDTCDDESDLPPLQTSSSPPGSPPISPTSMSSIPSVLVVPTSPSEDEKGEATPASRSHRRTGSRAKDSIAAGIGLWEPDFGFPSATTSGDATPRNGSESESESESSGRATDTKKASADRSDEFPQPDTGKLEPILQIVTRGFGAVVELRLVEGLRSADPEEGIALVVLRESG